MGRFFALPGIDPGERDQPKPPPMPPTWERAGRPIGGYDLLIAGHARSRGLVVVTGKPGEFSRVDGLGSEDWLPAN